MPEVGDDPYDPIIVSHSFQGHCTRAAVRRSFRWVTLLTSPNRSTLVAAIHFAWRPEMKSTWSRLLDGVSPAAWGWGVSALLHAGAGAALMLGMNGWEHQPPSSHGSQAGITLEATLRGARAQPGDADEETPVILVQVAAPPLKVETIQPARPALPTVATKQPTPIATAAVLTKQTTESPNRPQESPKIAASEAEPRPRQLASIAAPNVIVVAPDVVGTDVHQPPTPWANRPPLYPDQAILERREGIVQLRIAISASGKVTNVEITRSSTHSILDAAAVRAARSWRFEPAKENGTAVETVESQEIRFELRD